MIDYITNLGKRLSSEWGKYKYDHKIFPTIILDNIDIGKIKYDESEIMHTLTNDNLLNIQTASVFSEMNTRLYSDDKLYIELLQWCHLDTDLHDHNFSGILMQIAGCSLDVTYGFDETRMFNDELSFGNFSIERIDLLRSENKDIQIINAGSEYKHAVSHVGIPTVSLIIRTQPLVGFCQNIYFPDCIKAKYNMHTVDNKFIRLIKYLFNFNTSEAWNVIAKYIEMNIKVYPNKVLILLILLYEYLALEESQAKLYNILCDHSCGQEIFNSLKAFVYYKLHSKDKKNIDMINMNDRLYLASQSLSFGNQKWFGLIHENVKNIFK